MTVKSCPIWLVVFIAYATVGYAEELPKFSEYCKKLTEPEQLEETGLEAFQHGKFAKAIACWSQSATLSLQPSKKISLLIYQAEAYQRLGYLSETLLQLCNALELVEPNNPIPVNILANLGVVYTSLVDPNKTGSDLKICKVQAESILKTAMELVQKEPSTEAKLATLLRLNLAILKEEYHSACELYQQLGNSIINQRENLCKRELSKESLLKDLQLPIPYPHDQFHNLFTHQQFARQLADVLAQSYLMKGLEEADKTGSVEAKINLYLNLGNVLALQGKKAIAFCHYQQAAQLAQQVANFIFQHQALNNMMTVLLELESEPEKTIPQQTTCQLETQKIITQQLSDFLTQHLPQLPNSHDTVYALLKSAQILGFKQESGRLLQQAREMAHRLEDKRAESLALGYLAQFYEEAKNLGKAIQLTRQAIFLAQEINEWELLVEWNLQNAHLLKIQREKSTTNQLSLLDSEISAYKQAVFARKAVRSELEACRYNNSNSSQKRFDRNWYLELADRLLQRAEINQKKPAKIKCQLLLPNHQSQEEIQTKPDLYDTQTQCDLRNAQQAAEEFKADELRDYFQDECITELKEREVSLEQLPLPLNNKNTAIVVYPILLPNRTVILLRQHDRIQQITLKDKPKLAESLTDQEWLKKETGQLTNAISPIKDTSSKNNKYVLSKPDVYMPILRRLYDWLIRPIEKATQNQAIDTILFVQERLFRTIPIAALYDNKTGQYLVEKYAIGILPRLTLIPSYSKNQGWFYPLHQKHKLLLSGLSEKSKLLLSGLSKEREQFNPLPYVKDELKNIKDLCEQANNCQPSELLLDEKFEFETLKEKLRQYPYAIVHISTHTYFKNNSKETFILTGNERLTIDDLEDLIKISQFRDDPVELLTLSACDTAKGDDRAALGLAGVSIKAKARSALATLWSVNEQSTARLMRKFYEALEEKKCSRIEALQQAQQDLLNDNNFKHPYYWSAFLLIGNWL